ncbi:MAG: cytochrome c oxidase assembly protein, partial [Thermomicrobium sp.]|nr:cytochrome c oxidase assembly protein [Thermomicrobium sp.]
MPEPLVQVPLRVFLDPSYWSWRWPVLLVLSWFAGSVVVGTLRLWRGRGRNRWPLRRSVWLGFGLGGLKLALLSPLDALGGAVFSWHMVQHLALLYAAPLVLAGRPFPAVLWSLPRPARAALGRALRPGGTLRRIFAAMTSPVGGLAAGTLSLWIWHYPPLYDAVLTRRWLHDLEHVTFFAGALLCWWPVTEAPPVRRIRSDAVRTLYLVLGGLQSGLLGALVTFWPGVLYHRYLLETVDPVRVQADQVFGGLVM